MKTTRLSAAILLLGSLTLCMAEVSTDAQIEALKTATNEERVELMNEFKTMLSTLSQEERASAIEKFHLNIETQDVSKAADSGSQYTLTNRTQVGSQHFMLKNSGESSNLCESGDFKYQRAK